MYNRIVFGGTLSAHLAVSLPDLSKREYTMLIALILPTVLFGIYPAPILDGLHYSVSTLIHAYNDQLGAEQLTMSLFLVGSSKGSAFMETMKKIILHIGTVLATTGKNLFSTNLAYSRPEGWAEALRQGLVPDHIKVVGAGWTDLLTSDSLEPIITEINRLIPQLNGFITTINKFVQDNGINVVTNGYGEIGVDVLESVGEAKAQSWANRVEISHSVIIDRMNTLNALLDRAEKIEMESLEANHDFRVRVPDLRANYNTVKSNYKFISN